MHKVTKAYKSLLDQYGDKLLPDNHPYQRMCENVVARLAPVTGLEGVDWKVHVIKDDTPNAFVIPGGKIFVFTVSLSWMG